LLLKIGYFLYLSGNFRQSETHYLQAIELFVKLAGRHAPETSQARQVLALILMEEGRASEAQRLLEEMLEWSRKAMGENDPMTLNLKRQILESYRGQGRESKVADLAPQLINQMIHVMGRDDATTINTTCVLGFAYVELERFAEAAQLFEELLQRQVMKGAGVFAELQIKSRLIKIYVGQGRIDEAIKLGKESLETSLNQFGADHLLTLAIMDNLALAFYRRQTGEAIRLLEQALEKRVASSGAEQTDTVRTMFYLARCFYQQEETSKGDALSDRLFECGKKLAIRNDGHVVKCFNELVRIYEAAGRRTQKGEEIKKFLADNVSKEDETNSTLDIDWR
jgi:tetratricopeptide (TPR) repeat protein